jgi:hypothetical protein
MEQVVPWSELSALIELHYAKNKMGSRQRSESFRSTRFRLKNGSSSEVP